MPETFNIEGDLNPNTRTLLVLELNSIIESMQIDNNLFKITIFDAREGFEEILNKFGLKIIKKID